MANPKSGNEDDPLKGSPNDTRQPSTYAWIDRGLEYLRRNRLHPVLEVVISWNVATACLLYYGYSYVSSLRVTSDDGTTQQLRLPLMTHVRTRRSKQGKDLVFEIARIYKSIAPQITKHCKEDETLVQQIRGDSTLRRNVSRFVVTMTEFEESMRLDSSKDGTASLGDNEIAALYKRLKSIWLELLALPSLDAAPTSGFDVSLIVPAYKELGTNVASTLQWTQEQCLHPQKVQVIVVDAGLCTDLNACLTSAPSGWGDFQIVQYTGENGRGPCQNTGAQHATGQLLTFLHSDTAVPEHWDEKVKRTLTTLNDDVTTIQACAFSFGHNTSSSGLGGMGYPWGIRSIWFLGNFRAYLFSLPYGDHIISVPASYFHYVGGFPHQPIMEDYDLMDLFRRRAKVLAGETMRIIRPPCGKCSVRRWQAYGVVYVTLVNALLVNRYAHGNWTADEIFEYYYNCRGSSQGKDKAC